ncbi:hypothetical protein FQR65_LT17002 [Abscondita terminalis]|nr:hypothetical protein FQR65_LT17002 [Abscondita terminalis]
MEITISGKTYNNPVFVFAMEKEAGNEFKDLQRVFTGIGKILLSTWEPQEVQLSVRGDVVCCTQFVQEIWMYHLWVIERFKTPFSDDDVVLDYGIDIDNLPKGICGTGDSFETEHNTDLYNVLDMETYALALIAKREQIPFLCMKYISDGANDDAVEDWTQEVDKASKILREVIDKRF